MTWVLLLISQPWYQYRRLEFIGYLWRIRYFATTYDNNILAPTHFITQYLTGICVGTTLECVSRNLCVWCSLITPSLQFFFRHKLLQQFDYYWRIECVKKLSGILSYRYRTPTDQMFNSTATYIMILSCTCKITRRFMVRIRMAPPALAYPQFLGFTLSLPEYVSTIETLWQTTKG